MKDWQLAWVCLQHIPTNKSFGGVFACDKLPKIQKQPIFFIVNADRSHQEGSHWMLIYILSSNIQIWYDPLGESLNKYDILLQNYMISNFPNYRSTPNPTQHPHSRQCGQFCLHMADMLCHGYKFEQVLSTLTFNPSHFNETLVREYVTQHMIGGNLAGLNADAATKTHNAYDKRGENRRTDHATGDTNQSEHPPLLINTARAIQATITSIIRSRRNSRFFLTTNKRS